MLPSRRAIYRVDYTNENLASKIIITITISGTVRRKQRQQTNQLSIRDNKPRPYLRIPKQGQPTKPTKRQSRTETASKLNLNKESIANPG